MSGQRQVHYLSSLITLSEWGSVHPGRRGLPCRFVTQCSQMTSAGGGLRFMIAVCDTSACSLRLKVHADVSLTAILGALPPRSGAGTPDRAQNATFPSETPAMHLWLRIVTRPERDVALGVIGPAAGFRRSGVDSVPHKITENDTQPCTPAPKAHGCVSQTVILTNPGQCDLAI